MNEMLVEDSISADAMSRELEELRAKLRQTDNDRKQKLMEEQTFTMEIGVSCLSCALCGSLAVLLFVSLPTHEIGWLQF